MRLRLCLIFAIGIVFVGIAACGDDSTTTTQPRSVEPSPSVEPTSVPTAVPTTAPMPTATAIPTPELTTPDRSADCHSATAAHSNGCT